MNAVLCLKAALLSGRFYNKFRSENYKRLTLKRWKMWRLLGIGTAARAPMPTCKCTGAGEGGNWAARPLSSWAELPVPHSEVSPVMWDCMEWSQAESLHGVVSSLTCTNDIEPNTR